MLILHNRHPCPRKGGAEEGDRTDDLPLRPPFKSLEEASFPDPPFLMPIFFEGAVKEIGKALGWPDNRPKSQIAQRLAILPHPVSRPARSIYQDSQRFNGLTQEPSMPRHT